MCQGVARRADSLPSPKGPATLHTVSWGLLGVRALGHSQATPIERVLDSHVKRDSDKLEKTQKKKPQCGYKE